MRILIEIEPETAEPMHECQPIRLALLRMLVHAGCKVTIDGLANTYSRLEATGFPTKEKIDDVII